MDSTLRDRLMALGTTSLVDAAPDLRVLPATIRPVAPGRRLVGVAVTARAHRDLMSVIAGLRAAGPGDVLVVDAGGDDRAVAGDLFSTEAQRRGLAGIVISGCCRDSATLATMGLPVFASGVAPRAYAAVRLPDVGADLSIGAITVSAGDIVVGDDDGIVIGTEAEVAAVVDAAEAIEAKETGLRAAMAGGAGLFDSMNYDEHLAALTEGRESALSLG